MKVLSTIALVEKGLTDSILSLYPDWKIVYDENLDYQSSVEKLRKKNLMNKDFSDTFPLFSFKRSVLHESNYIPRQTNVDVYDLGETTQNFANIFKASYATFDLDFLIYSPDITDMEVIEIEYLSRQSLKGITNFKVQIPGITLPLPYIVVFGELDSFKINVKDKFYKALGGKSQVSGWFLILPDNPTYPKILEIRKRILNFHNEVLEGEDITP